MNEYKVLWGGTKQKGWGGNSMKIILLTFLLLCANLQAEQKECNHLKSIEVFPTQSGQNAQGSLRDIPSQIIFDFKKEVEVEEKVNNKKFELQLVFSQAMIEDFETSRVVERIQKIALVKKVSIKSLAKEQKVIVTIFFQDGVMVHLSKIGKPHNSRRLVVGICSHKMLQALERSDRVLQLAAGTPQGGMPQGKKKIFVSL